MKKKKGCKEKQNSILGLKEVLLDDCSKVFRLSDQVQDLFQGSGGQSKCKGKVGSFGNWANRVKTWQVL